MIIVNRILAAILILILAIIGIGAHLTKQYMVETACLVGCFVAYKIAMDDYK